MNAINPLPKDNSNRPYADPTAWERIELLSQPMLGFWSQSYSRIIKEISNIHCLRVWEIGCGTGHITNDIFRTLEVPLSYYVGLDLDSYAIETAKAKLTNISAARDFITNTALDSSVIEALTGRCNLILCLSNTFLSMGGKSDLATFLKSIRRFADRDVKLIISVVPWLPTQKAYNEDLADWYLIQRTTTPCWVKMKITESEEAVMQSIFINSKDSDVGASFFNHDFIKTSPEQIEQLFTEGGWHITSWRSPFDASIVNPYKSDLPEYIITCEGINA